MSVPATLPAKLKIAATLIENRDLAASSADRIDLLVREAKAGSTIAFEELCFIYRGRLLQRLNTITRHQEDAEDALQNACLSAFRALGSFEGRSTFGTWFTRIAINNALQQLRTRRRRAEEPLLSDADGPEFVPRFDPVDRAPNPEEVCKRRQLEARMYDAISRLPISLRTALELHLNEDLPREDIARRLEITQAAAKSRLSRAKAILVQSTSQNGSNPVSGARQLKRGS